MNGTDRTLQGFPLQLGRTRPIDERLRGLPRRQTIKRCGAFHLSLELRDIPKVVQREGITGIKEISFVKKCLGLVEMILFYGFHAFAVESLNRRQLATLGKRDP